MREYIQNFIDGNKDHGVRCSEIIEIAGKRHAFCWVSQVSEQKYPGSRTPVYNYIFVDKGSDQDLDNLKGQPFADITYFVNDKDIIRHHTTPSVDGISLRLRWKDEFIPVVPSNIELFPNQYLSGCSLFSNKGLNKGVWSRTADNYNLIVDIPYIEASRDNIKEVKFVSSSIGNEVETCLSIEFEKGKECARYINFYHYPVVIWSTEDVKPLTFEETIANLPSSADFTDISDCSPETVKQMLEDKGFLKKTLD